MPDQPAPHGEQQSSNRRYRYGEISTWQLVLNAVKALDGPVSPGEVGAHIVASIPDFARANLSPDLSVMSVNSNSRGHHAVNTRPRRTDTGNPYDQLFRIGRGRGVRYVLYDPAVHGVWELYDPGVKPLRPRLISSADDIELERARNEVRDAGALDPTDSEDARRRIMASVVQREGQPAFRESLLRAYGNACAITGCTVVPLLEAAHIIPYRGPHTNVVSNGLLLRADLHKLFDLHLIRIDPARRTLHVSEELMNSEYGSLAGQTLRPPSSAQDAPSIASLADHQSRCVWAALDLAQ